MGTPSLSLALDRWPIALRRRDGRIRTQRRTLLPFSVAAAVRDRTVRWVGIAALIWRTLTMLVILALSLSWTEQYPGLVLAALLVSAANAVWLLVALAGRFTLWLHPAVIALDVIAAVGLNVGTSALIQHDWLYVGYPWHDLFFPYMWGTVALWAGVRGPVTGLLILVLAAGPLQLAMTMVNDYPFTANLPAIADRDSWAVAAFLLTLGAAYLAQRTAEAVALASHQTAKVEVLSAMHDTAIQALDGIVLKAAPSQMAASDRLTEVHDFAQQQAEELRAAYRRHLAALEDIPTLTGGLAELAATFRRRGLAIDLLTHELTAELPPAAVSALLGATREALTNVDKHAGTDRVVVRATTREDGTVLTIRDQGRGFAVDDETVGLGLSGSIIGRTRAVGGTAAISSRPGHGTKVTLWVPR